jgi:hypothetical protein
MFILTGLQLREWSVIAPSTLQPGKSRVERYLLNFKHEISALGGYWVRRSGAAPERHIQNCISRWTQLDLPSEPVAGVGRPAQVLKWRDMRLEAARNLGQPWALFKTMSTSRFLQRS